MRWVTLPLTHALGLACGFLMASLPVSSAPPGPVVSLEVLHDSGQTVPLRPLLEAAGLLEQTQLPIPTEQAPRLNTVLAQHLTVRSPSLSPGVQPRLSVGQAGAMLPQPLFLIGADPGSIAWLRKHHASLASIGAVGLLVEAAGAEEVQLVRAAAGELVLAVGSGELLAEHFGLHHYPVLIGPQWIEQ